MRGRGVPTPDLYNIIYEIIYMIIQTHFRFSTSLVLVILISAFFSLHGQNSSSIVGHIFEESTNEYLPGAVVFLEGTNFTALTDIEGKYIIPNVPPGTYILRNRYLGYEPYSTEIFVPENGQIVQIDIPLKISYLDEIVIWGQREGQAKALNQQKENINITNIVAREQIDRFPDQNTAEVLQRVVGVNILRDRGEGRFVALRGGGPRLTSTWINGEKIATPEDEERFVALDVISSGQLSGIEVVKTIVPEQDADAISGIINLNTRSAFDRKDPFFRISAGSGYNFLAGKPNYQARFIYASKLGFAKKLGISISGNWQQANRATNNSELRWGDREDINENPIPFALREIELRDYFNKRDRFGLNTRLDFRPNDKHAFYAFGMFNRRDDDQRRNHFRLRIDRGDYLSATQVEGARLIRQLQDRIESQTIMVGNIGGEHLFGNLSVDYRFTYSYGKQNKDAPDGQIGPEFQLNEEVDMDLDITDPDVPRYTFTNLDESYVFDPINYELDQMDYRTQFTSNDDYVGRLNLGIPLKIGNAKGEIKAGGKYRSSTKDRDNERFRYKWEGNGNIFMDRFAANDAKEDFLLGDYNFGPTINPSFVRSFFFLNRDNPEGLEGELRYEDTEGESYEASEEIIAYYVSSKLDIGKLSFLLGVRHEFTTTDYSGTFLQFDEEGEFSELGQQANSRSYNDIFPNAQAKLRIGNNSNLRVAATRGIARANYFDLVPYEWQNLEDEEILRGNPNLNPTTSLNLDVLGEHFFQGIGIISGGVFYKNLDQIIYDATFEEDGFEIIQPINGGSATLLGVELSWQQQFTFLPGFLGGFGIYANYTHIEAQNVELQFRERADVLPGQASDAGNLALTFEKYGVTARISVNYNGKVIDEVGSNEDFDQWRDDHIQVDFSSTIRVGKGLDFFVNVININNAVRRDYLGIEERPILREYFGTWTNAGIQWTLE